jgi:pimeloyl-ACP methyl ester carboxylesterase
MTAMSLVLILIGTVMAESERPVNQSVKDWITDGKFMKFEGLNIFVHTSGEDPVKGHGVLVVHGYPGSSWDFSNVASIVQKKTKIVIPDMIGFGQSDTPLKGTFKENFSLMRQADLYEAVAAAEGFETVILVAHDMGQTVGLELMARQEEGKLPFRIKHAILLNGSTLVDMVQLTDGQKASLKLPDQALTEAAPKEEWVKDLDKTFGAKMRADKAAHKLAIDCQVAQIYANDGALVMSNIVRYLLERKEFYDR